MKSKLTVNMIFSLFFLIGLVGLILSLVFAKDTDSSQTTLNQTSPDGGFFQGEENDNSLIGLIGLLSIVLMIISYLVVIITAMIIYFKDRTPELNGIINLITWLSFLGGLAGVNVILYFVVINKDKKLNSR